jgi:MFS family permease
LPRRRVLVALDLSRAATVLLLPFVDAVWQVYVLIFVINACSAGFTPLFQATIPDVLPDEAVYTRALSLSRLAYDLQQLLAPALAGVLLWFLPLGAPPCASACSPQTPPCVRHRLPSRVLAEGLSPVDTRTAS